MKVLPAGGGGGGGKFCVNFDYERRVTFNDLRKRGRCSAPTTNSDYNLVSVPLQVLHFPKKNVKRTVS